MSEESVIYPGGMLGQLAIALEKMGWEQGDNIAVELEGLPYMELMVQEQSGHQQKEPVSIIKMRSLLLRTLTAILLHHHNQTQI